MSPPHQQQSWPLGPERPALTTDEAHVWRAALDVDDEARGQLFDTLSSDERDRAARFHFKKDRHHFVAARGRLRAILGRYLNAEPARLSFTYDYYGKPSLAGEWADATLRFNVSHSRAVALYALTEGRAVGVDVESVREEFAGLDIAERFFSRREVEALREVAPEERASAFFDCWTRKEAYIKALGEGLSHPLHLFTVSLTPGRPAALLSTDTDAAEAARWSLLELHPGEGYRAALAVRGRVQTLRCWSHT